MKHQGRRRRLTALGSVVAMIATSLALTIGLAGPAGATSSGTIGYEADCAGVGLAAGNTAPFGVFVTGNTTTDTAFPTGATFGASGAVVVNASGAFIAGLTANGFSSGGLGVDTLKVGARNATGTYTLNDTGASNSASYPGRTIAGVTSNSTNVLTGPFLASDAGNFVGGAAGGINIPNGTVIVSVVPGTSATLSQAAANSTTSAVGTGSVAGVNYTFPFTTPANAFTTAGNATQQAQLAMTAVNGFSLTSTLTLQFGNAGTPCDMTGWTSGGTPSVPAPLFPFGTPGQTALVSVSPTVTPVFAYATLADSAPLGNGPATVNLAVGGSKGITLTSTSPGTPANFYEITTAPSDLRLAANITNPGTGAATVTDSGSGPATVTFSFRACNGADSSGIRTTAYQVTNGGVNCGAPFQVTVKIGTAPVDEPLGQQVNPGQLVLSCNSPETYVSPPAVTPGSPSTLCPEFDFADVTLNGLAQTRTGSGNTLYVSDNRGDPAVGWSVTASFVATPTNPNASCVAVVAFCNSDLSIGSHALDASGNGQIQPSNLLLNGITCPVHAGNLNPAATPGLGGTLNGTINICSANATQSGGTFDIHRTFTLTIPSSVYAGKYIGTVEYLVQ